jgi:hypothetical protein
VIIQTPDPPATLRLPLTQARRERSTMATAATETTRLIGFMLPSSPYSTQMARFYCRAALRYHGLGEFVNDAEIVVSELATNASAPRGALSYPRCSRDEPEGGSWV